MFFVISIFQQKKVFLLHDQQQQPIRNAAYGNEGVRRQEKSKSQNGNYSCDQKFPHSQAIPKALQLSTNFQNPANRMNEPEKEIVEDLIPADSFQIGLIPMQCQMRTYYYASSAKGLCFSTVILIAIHVVASRTCR